MAATFCGVEQHFAASPGATINGLNGVKYPGCTALSVLLWGSWLVVANAGTVAGCQMSDSQFHGSILL